MKLLGILALSALLLAPAQQEEWLEEIKKMDEQLNQIQGTLYLLRSMRQEMLRALKALDESRLDLVDRHLLRLAHVTRPYNENHANQVVAIALALRGETRADGAALVAGVADDLKLGKPKEAQARIDEALKSPFLATTHKAEIERLLGWLKAPPDPKTVEAEIARWTTLMPPGYALACATCQSRGEADCGSCQSGLVMQSCRTCAGKGQGACAQCSGKGTVPHGGFAGDILLRVDKLFRYKNPDGKGNRRVDPQRIFWNLSPCGGKGTVRLKGRSVYHDPKLTPLPPVELNLPCAEVFAQMKANVFTGKAKIFAHPKEDKNEMTVEQAQRFFSEYEKCVAGRIPCDSCEGKGAGACRPCGGKGERLGPCSNCAGAGSAGCPACKASGDSAWLAAKVPAARAPAVGGCLDNHVRALLVWQDKRAGARARREQVRGQLAEARKGLDPDAKLTPEFVNVKCSKCAGKGGTCEECWGVGRREFFPGTPAYEKYAKVQKLQEQFAVLSMASLGVSSAEIQLELKDEALNKDFKAPPPSTVPPPAKKGPGVGSGIGGRIADLPADMRDSIAQADTLHEDGKKAYEYAANAWDDDPKRKSEAVRAKDCFKQAAELFGKVLETLDEQGISTPQELNDKYNKNLQALKLARNMAF
ncbi:MAG TPA: hypothetical protein VFC86_12425 [Planctomycetota bacterium]|nr:hypothetical protein [Planctomycetota bacterium]